MGKESVTGGNVQKMHIANDETKDSKEGNGLVLFVDNGKKVQINADFKNDTFWATQAQIVELFDSSKANISEHIKHIFEDGELDESSTVRKFRTVQKEGNRTVERDVEHYNLDVILSVGYRVHSKVATRFRQWATRILKEHLLQGYTINNARLAQLGKALEILSRSTDEMVLSVASLINDFTGGLDLLDSYDHSAFKKPEGAEANTELTYENAREFIDAMKFGSDSELFGNERDEIFKGVLGSVYQTFAGQELYSSLQEKAANLLYMVVKDHPFTDGNKRIAAGLFVYFLELNGALRDTNGSLIIDNNSLAAITLMIALSKPEEKEIMCLLVMNMLTEEGGR